MKTWVVSFIILLVVGTIWASIAFVLRDFGLHRNITDLLSICIGSGVIILRLRFVNHWDTGE